MLALSNWTADRSRIAESRWLIASLLGQLTCRREKISANVVENPVEKSSRLRRCDADF
jgi:hypothetical protein